MDETKISNAIKEARPKLSTISPLVAKIVLGFAGVNLLLGYGLISTKAQLATPILVAPTIESFQYWGIAFGLLGLAMIGGYIANNWKFLRATFVIGMLFKFAWLIALGSRYFAGDYDNPILLIVWLFFAYIQAVTYVHFLPLPVIQKGAEDAGQ